MKKTTFIVMMILVGMVIASTGAFAITGTALSFAFTLPGIGTDADTDTVDLGSVGPWTVKWTGSATISPTSSVATLTGNVGGKIWTYAYSTDNATWTPLTPLVDTFSASAYAVGDSGTQFGGWTTVTARYLKLSYDATLTSSTKASASGSGSIVAIPEPGTILAALSILGPVGFVFRRRR